MPALMAAMFILPAYFMSQDDTKERSIAVYDGSSILLGQLESTDYTKYKFIPKEEYDKIKDNIKVDFAIGQQDLKIYLHPLIDS